MSMTSGCCLLRLGVTCDVLKQLFVLGDDVLPVILPNETLADLGGGAGEPVVIPGGE